MCLRTKYTHTQYWLIKLQQLFELLFDCVIIFFRKIWTPIRSSLSVAFHILRTHTRTYAHTHMHTHTRTYTHSISHASARIHLKGTTQMKKRKYTPSNPQVLQSRARSHARCSLFCYSPHFSVFFFEKELCR